jgi:hypothetical protein
MAFQLAQLSGSPSAGLRVSDALLACDIIQREVLAAMAQGSHIASSSDPLPYYFCRAQRRHVATTQRAGPPPPSVETART